MSARKIANIFGLTVATISLLILAGHGGSNEETYAARQQQAVPKARQRVGPLKVLRTNRRYFTDGTGRAVYLTGSHVWWNLVGPPPWHNDCQSDAPPPSFDYKSYLDSLERHGHNFIRLWAIEFAIWRECGAMIRVGLHPWPRTGPGRGADGLPRFDLSRFNQAYFRRLRARVVAAGQRHMYVSIMLFEGWGAQFFERPWNARGHPFYRTNNVNGIDADRNRDGSILEIYTMSKPKIRRLQDAYVRKVVSTVDDLDNVLYEVANESGAFSTAWQYHMVRLVKRTEARMKKRHPVGMSFQHKDWTGAALFHGPADWVAPKDVRHLTDPPAAGARKVTFSDTDHHCGVCGDSAFVWKTFMRGYNPVLMDPMTPVPSLERARLAMGNTRQYASRIGLASMAPRGDLCSTTYCLVAVGREYLVYQPTNGPFSVNLRAAGGRQFALEWMHPVTGAITRAGVVQGGDVRAFSPPFGGPAVLYLRRSV